MESLLYLWPLDLVKLVPPATQGSCPHTAVETPSQNPWQPPHPTAMAVLHFGLFMSSNVLFECLFLTICFTHYIFIKISKDETLCGTVLLLYFFGRKTWSSVITSYLGKEKQMNWVRHPGPAGVFPGHLSPWRVWSLVFLTFISVPLPYGPLLPSRQCCMREGHRGEVPWSQRFPFILGGSLLEHFTWIPLSQYLACSTEPGLWVWAATTLSVSSTAWHQRVSGLRLKCFFKHLLLLIFNFSNNPVSGFMMSAIP